VGPTVHTHSSSRVRGYRFFAGERVLATIQLRTDDHGDAKDYMKLIEPELLWLCPGCAADPAIVERFYETDEGTP
jgi:hypothetical protein